MRYTVGQIEKMNAELEAEPEEDKGLREVTKQEAIRLMIPGIESMRKKGYTLERVADRLGARGVNITAGTLRSYLRRLGRGRMRLAKKAEAPTPARKSQSKPLVETPTSRPPAVRTSSQPMQPAHGGSFKVREDDTQT